MSQPAVREGQRATWRRGIVGLALLLLACGAMSGLLAGRAPAASEMPQATVRLAGQVFHVDVADTIPLQRRGLGGRRALGPAEGMLFPYAERGYPTFWMLDMVIPIDIIWIDSTRVVHIEHNVPPPAPGTPAGALPSYRPSQPANAVLEIAAGRAQALNVRVGSRVEIEY
jgi:hypothetical protein